MIGKALLDVAAFTQKFPPRPAEAIESARKRMILEEARELHDEIGGPRYKIAHEAIDLIYVALGAMVEAGISPEEAAAAFEEVHRSNMAKRVVPERWKAIKPPGWTPPDVAGAMERARRALPDPECVACGRPTPMAAAAGWCSGPVCETCWAGLP